MKLIPVLAERGYGAGNVSFITLGDGSIVYRLTLIDTTYPIAIQRVRAFDEKNNISGAVSSAVLTIIEEAEVTP